MPKESLIRKKAIQILEERGWICWYPSKVKYQQTDVFGIIDVLALRKREKKNVSAKRKKITDFLTKFKVDLAVEIWAWDGKKKIFRKEKVGRRA